MEFTKGAGRAPLCAHVARGPSPRPAWALCAPRVGKLLPQPLPSARHFQILNISQIYFLI